MKKEFSSEFWKQRYMNIPPPRHSGILLSNAFSDRIDEWRHALGTTRDAILTLQRAASRTSDSLDEYVRAIQAGYPVVPSCYLPIGDVFVKQGEHLEMQRMDSPFVDFIPMMASCILVGTARAFTPRKRRRLRKLRNLKRAPRRTLLDRRRVLQEDSDLASLVEIGLL